MTHLASWACLAFWPELECLWKMGLIFAAAHLPHCNHKAGSVKNLKSAAHVFTFSSHRHTHTLGPHTLILKHTYSICGQTRTHAHWLDQSFWHFNPLHFRTSSHTLVWCVCVCACVCVCMCVCVCVSEWVSEKGIARKKGERESVCMCVCERAMPWQPWRSKDLLAR